MNRCLFFSVVVLAAFTGCAYNPIVDTMGVDMNRYQTDLNECAQYATQVDPGANAAASAVGGAVIGAVLGAIFGNSRDVGQLAAAGAIAGGVGGGAGGAAIQQNIIRNCLSGRGYRVLY